MTPPEGGGPGVSSRIPANLEVSGLIRAAHAAGGFAAVLHKGEPDSGTILVVALENGGIARLFERMPQLDGSRKWVESRVQDIDRKSEFDAYLARRSGQDPDVWIIELDIANPERLIRFED